MAHRIDNDLDGYEESRFEAEVRQDLLCSICLKVLKDPKTCQNKEHAFCSYCITEHLRRSSTCPECREHLTPPSLKNPPRFLLNTLSVLKISCEYCDRGCPEHIRLENLQNHVDQCEYSPVMCGNEGCGREINKRDKESHEKDLCQFRIPKCHDCRDMKATQYQIQAAQDGLQLKINEMHLKFTEMERKQDQVDNKVNKIKENVEEIKQTQFEIKQQFEKICEMITQLSQGNKVNHNGTQPLYPAIRVHSAIDQDILILGGYSTGKDNVLKTVEKFDILAGNCAQLPPMNHPRAGSASCVYNNNVIVTGGYDGKAGTDTIEILKMDYQPLTWMLFGGKLPVKLSGHAIALYRGKIFIIGGANWVTSKTSDVIFEVCLTLPYTTKQVVRMPEPRTSLGAEVVNDKLFILGGTRTSACTQAMDSVVVYDFIENDFKPCASLPYAVCRMSTVTWGNMIIVVGGEDVKGNILNDVTMYDTEGGKSKKLPSMIFKRRGCSAVIMNDVIVVMGGWNKEQGHLNSVETFTIGDDGWKELSRMNAKRFRLNAVLKPAY